MICGGGSSLYVFVYVCMSVSVSLCLCVWVSVCECVYMYPTCVTCESQFSPSDMEILGIELVFSDVTARIFTHF